MTDIERAREFFGCKSHEGRVIHEYVCEVDRVLHGEQPWCEALAASYAAVRAEERERAAKVAEDHIVPRGGMGATLPSTQERNRYAEIIAAAIRKGE